MILENSSDFPSIDHVSILIEVQNCIHDQVGSNHFSFEVFECIFHKFNAKFKHCCPLQCICFSLPISIFCPNYILLDECVNFLWPDAEHFANLLWLYFLLISQVQNLSDIAQEISRFLGAWIRYSNFALNLLRLLEQFFVWFVVWILVIENCILLKCVNLIFDHC